MLGVVTAREGLERAVEAGLDLVEVSPNADPPVCKILNYGKYRYEIQKKAKEAKKKQKVIQVKEIKMRPATDDHDYDTKMRSAKRFLEEGDKVKFSLRFRGREMAHQQLGIAMLKRVMEDLKDLAEIEMRPRMEGKQATMIVAPLKS